MNKETTNFERKYYLDILRIIATFAVVAIHISSSSIDINSTNDWKYNVLFNNIQQWAVPVFFMISGALFLNKDYKLDIKKLYCKNIFRLLTSYCSWILIYSCYYYFIKGENTMITNIFNDGKYYHLWYLPVCITIYMFIPVLRKISQDRNITKYVLIILFLTQSLIPTLVRLNIPYIGYLKIVYDRFYFSGNIFIYIGYFLLGYYISQIRSSNKVRAIIYIFGILSVISSFFLTIDTISSKLEKATFIENFCVNIFVEAIAVFVLVKHIFENKRINPIPSKMIVALSKYTFGAYLVHLLIINVISNIFVPPYNVWSTIVLSVVVFIISIIISAILNHIPLIKKYIV